MINIPKASSQPEDQKEQGQWKGIPSSALSHRPRIARVLEREDDEQEDRTGYELREELTRLRKERLRVGAEDRRSGCLARRHRPDALAFHVINGRDIVGIDDACTDESAEELSKEVNWESSPRQLPIEAIRKSDRRVEIPSTVTSDVDAKHDTETPSPRNALVLPKAIATWRCRLALAEQDLCHAAVSEQHHYECSKKFCQRLPEYVAYPRQHQLIFCHDDIVLVDHRGILVEADT